MRTNGFSRRGWLAGLLTGLAGWLFGHSAAAGRGAHVPPPATGTCGRCGCTFEPVFCGSVTTYSFDGLGRLESVACPAGSVTTYHYDGPGPLRDGPPS